jgi:hypothetical protein
VNNKLLFHILLIRYFTIFGEIKWGELRKFPPSISPGITPVGSTGVFSLQRASSPWREPGDLAFLG